MNIPIDEFIPPAIEILWDTISAKNSVEGINIKKLFTKQLRLILANEHQVNCHNNISSKKLRHIISDLMKLRKIALKMQSKERKILFSTLLLALVTAFLETKSFRQNMEECTNDEGHK